MLTGSAELQAAQPPPPPAQEDAALAPGAGSPPENGKPAANHIPYTNGFHQAVSLDPESGEHPSDPVLRTAHDGDRSVTRGHADPASDHVDAALAKRREDVDEKHQRVIAFLEENGYDALVLGRADSVGWFSAGGEANRDLCGEASSVLLFVNKGGRAIFADNVQSARVFEEEFAGLGFQLKERNWNEGVDRIVTELSGSRRIATDCGLLGLPNEIDKLRKLRLSLSKFERRRLRELGWSLSAAIEATCRNFLPGESEADIAGHLAHRLIREGIVPVELSVAGDERLERFRRPTFKTAKVEKAAIITATGRRHGLCASASRIVCFGKTPAQFRSQHALAAMVDATLIYFSRPGEPIQDVFRRARRIYEKFGYTHEWTLDYAGGLVGYSPRELLFSPDSAIPLGSNVAVAWSPSVGTSRSGDTVLINERGFEVVTPCRRWPKVEVLVKGFAIERPGILER